MSSFRYLGQSLGKSEVISRSTDSNTGQENLEELQRIQHRISILSSREMHEVTQSVRRGLYNVIRAILPSLAWR